MSNHLIKHEGTVTSVDDGTVKVTICTESACSGCHAKGACGGMDFKEKEIEIRTERQYNVGDKVTVTITQSMGFKALFLGYLAPFILLVLSIVIAVAFKIDEGLAALLGLVAVALYYGVLYLNREKVEKSFNFTIE